MRSTIGPHSDPDKSLKTGQACHICAAARNGPRYKKDQTPEERRSIDNGIWMCSVCSNKIDKDFASFPREKLHEWKTRTEAFVSGDGAKPPLPDITIETLRGILLGFNGSTKVTGAEQQLLRDHKLKITNRHIGAMLQFQGRMQYPEGICKAELVQVPTGVHVDFKRMQDQFVAHISGRGSIEQLGPPRPAMAVTLGISKLLPGNSVEVNFRSVQNPLHGDFESMLESAGVEMSTRIFLEGSYQSEWQGRYLRCEFLVPLTYDSENRWVTSEPPESLGKRPRMHVSGFM